MKSLTKLLEVVLVATLALGMMAQPVILICSYVIGRRAEKEAEVEELVKAKRRAKAARTYSGVVEEAVDTLGDIEVVTLDEPDGEGLRKARETRGYHQSPRSAGHAAGYEDGCYDGENGYARHTHYDDTNDFSDDDHVKYEQGYEAGYREGYNAKAQE